MQRQRIQGQNVEEQLQKRQKTVMAQCVAGSKKSAASGIAFWFWFPTRILGYPEEATLPPKDDQDVLLYAGIVMCGGTAAHYTGHLGLGCAFEHLSVKSDTDNWRRLAKGVLKTFLILFGDPSRTKYPLTEFRVMQRVAVNIGRDTGEIAWPVLHAREACLRFQSEGLDVYVGEVDGLVSHPPGRPNGFSWIRQVPRSLL